MANAYAVGCTSDIGTDREKQEDYVTFEELDEHNLLCVVADGTGSRRNFAQPGAIAALEVTAFIRYMFHNAGSLFASAPDFFLRMALMNANRVLGAFKMGNEEILSGYASSLTCCLLAPGNHIYFSHAGNTRLYILRKGKLRQMTRDHTKGMDLYEQGLLSMDDYYQHPDRLKMTSGIGVVADPVIQTMAGKLQQNDLVIMTTDGIHYALRPDAMETIILQSEWVDQAASSLVSAAKDIVKYPDNMTAAVLCSSTFGQEPM